MLLAFLYSQVFSGILLSGDRVILSKCEKLINLNLVWNTV